MLKAQFPQESHLDILDRIRFSVDLFSNSVPPECVVVATIEVFEY